MGFFSLHASSKLLFMSTEQHEDAWHVQLESGEVRILSLDQLDAFFQNGIIDEETYILRDGTMDWVKLRVALGLDEEPAAAAAPVAPAAAPAQVPLVSYGAVPAYQFANNTDFETPYQTHLSTRPVVSEIDVGELDESLFKKKSKGKYFIAAGAAAAVVCMVAMVTANRVGSSASSNSVGASVVNAVPTTPAPVVTTPPPPVDPQPVAQTKLADDVKQALAAKDTQLNQKIEAKKQARAKSAPPALHKPSAPPFHKGGNAYDPLNAKL